MRTERKSKKKKSVILRLLVLGVCVYMLATLAGLLKTLNESRAQLAELNRQSTEIENTIAEQKNLLKDGSEAALIEKAARERLGYVYSDELIFSDVSGK